MMVQNKKEHLDFLEKHAGIKVEYFSDHLIEYVKEGESSSSYMSKKELNQIFAKLIADKVF